MTELLFATTCKIAVIGILLALGAWWYMRNFTPRRGEAKRIRVIQTQYIGNKERLILIEVDQQVLLLGATGHQISLLHSSTGDKSSFAEIADLALQAVPSK